MLSWCYWETGSNHVLLMSLLACGEKKEGSTGSSEPDLLDWNVMEPGDYRVGYQVLEAVIDLPAGNQQTIPINVWYPTLDTFGESARYFDLFDDDSVFLQASPSFRTASAPLLVYSHGKYLYGGSASYLMRHFASHGWVVAAPDHIHNTMLDYGDPVGLGHVVQRPLDNSAAIDAIASHFGSQVNTDSVLLSGFSFGGFDNWLTAGAAIQEDALVLHCDNGGFEGDCDDENQSAILSGLGDPRIAGMIPMAGMN